MASEIIYDAVRAFLTTQFTTSPLQWENESPITTTGVGGEPAPWVMVEMTGTLYAQQSLGASVQADNRWDEEGQLWLHVFVPTGTGGREARRIARLLADLFRGTTLLGDSLEFLDAQIGMGEAGDETGSWYRVSVEIDWRHMDA